MNDPINPDQSSAGHNRPLRRYVNYFEVQVSISEVDLRFGQRFGHGSIDPVVDNWMVTTPVHLLELGRAIDAAINRYRDRFGAIPDARRAQEPQG